MLTARCTFVSDAASDDVGTHCASARPALRCPCRRDLAGDGGGAEHWGLRSALYATVVLFCLAPSSTTASAAVSALLSSLSPAKQQRSVLHAFRLSVIEHFLSKFPLKIGSNLRYSALGITDVFRNLRFVSDFS